MFKIALRRVFYFFYALRYKESGKLKTVNNKVYRFPYSVVRGIPSIINERPLLFLQQLVKNKKVVIDVGANIGTISNIISNDMSPGGVIHAFEPTPSTFLILQDTARLVKGNVIIQPYNYAIAGENGVVYFETTESSTTNHIISDQNRGIAVTAVCLDWFCLTNGIRPEVIKIDVEGAEYLVLLGSQSILKKYKPEVLVELHIDQLRLQKVDCNLFGNLIEQIDYEAHSLDGEKIPSDLIFNYSCIHLVSKS